MHFRIIIFSFFFLAGQALHSQTLIGYYSGNATTIDRYPVQKLTHIIYSFCHLKGNRLHLGRDSATVKKLVRLKRKYPRLKILLSLGGWGGCATCSPVFANDKGRKEFAVSVKELSDRFNTDGIDIDWEFPAAPGFPGHPWLPEDRDNFTALLKALREKLGTDKEVSFLAACFSPYLRQSIDWKNVILYVDRINLMTYDIIGSRNKLTGHHANLFSTSWQQESADNAIRYLDSLKIPRNKIAIGVAFYGREFINVPAINNGLHQPGSFKRFITLNSIRKNYTPANGYNYYWDEEAQAPWLYNPSRKSYITFDDERSAAAKSKYAKEKGLNGIMFWELRQDLPNKGLVEVLSARMSIAPGFGLASSWLQTAVFSQK